MHMVNLNEYIDELTITYDIQSMNFKETISKFFVSNNWFGEAPQLIDGNLFVEDSFIEKNGDRICAFCQSCECGYDDKLKKLCSKMSKIMPKTARFFQQYVKRFKLHDSDAYRLADFLLYYLPGEINEADNAEIETLLNDVYDNLSKTYGDIICDFINWISMNTETFYNCHCSMNAYYKDDSRTSAYNEDGYLEILYHLFNAEYIDKNDMYAQAAESKNYVDAWLFLALHFICVLRNTDLQRLPHPSLPSEPQDVLDRIESGVFTEEEAKQTLYSIIWTLEATLPTPNKTKRYSGVSSIKFFVPASVEAHMGTLFAAAEAHFQISGAEPERPLVRVISSYEQIRRYMGEEIGDLFLSSDFRSRAANKSYMQMIYLLTDDILGINDEFNVKGYTLAALARSHKGSYGEFAKETATYLKDAKMSGFTPEFVAKELFERGVLSSISSMLLKMVTNGEYSKLSVSNQTKMIQELNMTPSEVERSVQIMQVNTDRSLQIAKSVYENCTKEDILTILHRIGNGEAVSKCDNCYCLKTAMGMPCPYPDNSNCPGCPYEISTKWTMFLMTTEFLRLKSLSETTDSALEKEKNITLAQRTIIPAMEEILSVMKENYGDEAADSLQRVIKEVLNGKQQ